MDTSQIDLFFKPQKVPIQKIDLDLFGIQDYTLSILREDTLHATVSGNKFRKLKYNILEAKHLKIDTLLTYGGAFSNHIAAVASIGKHLGFNTVGIIRGEEWALKLEDSTTLKFAKECGMQLQCISREQYRNKTEKNFHQNLQKQWGFFYEIPEGGSNTLAIKGCEEIWQNTKLLNHDVVAVAVGTGGTLAGLIANAPKHVNCIGYSVLKGTFQREAITNWIGATHNIKLTDAYCFGGYAKVTEDLVQFINYFKKHTGILLDPIYTAKLLFGLISDMKARKFPLNSRILAVHTGGLQGIAGINLQRAKKKLPLINV